MAAVLTVEIMQRWLWLAASLCLAVLLLRLWRTGLWRRYRCFTFLILAELAQSLTVAAVAPRTDLYALLYLAFVLILAVAYVLAVLEVYSLVLERYAGLINVGRWAISLALALSLVVAAVTIYPDVSGSAGASPLLLFMRIFQRILYSALLFFLLVITGFLLWFPIPLPRNTVLHTIVFGLFFASQALLLLFRNVGGPGLTRVLSAAHLGVYVLCVSAWCIFLSPRGERVTYVLGQHWSREIQDRLVSQLDSLNSALMRAAKK